MRLLKEKNKNSHYNYHCMGNFFNLKSERKILKKKVLKRNKYLYNYIFFHFGFSLSHNNKLNQGYVLSLCFYRGNSFKYPQTIVYFRIGL